MAASTDRAFDMSDESSSSEDENLEKLKEAVWNAEGTKKTAVENKEKQPSRRLVVADHQHDGNELQVTPEFRAHVAKKLEHILDGYISEKPAETVSHEAPSVFEDIDQGFRLFATSLPGQTVDEPPCPVRRRPIPSSSESDEEMERRIREAAVSVKDLLPPSSLPHMTSPSPTDAPMEQVNGSSPSETSRREGPEKGPLPKRKKKRKRKKATGERGEDIRADVEKTPSEEPAALQKRKRKNQEEVGQVSASSGSSLPARKTDGEQENHAQEEASTHTKVKRKRKKTKSESCR